MGQETVGRSQERAAIGSAMRGLVWAGREPLQARRGLLHLYCHELGESWHGPGKAIIG